MCASVVARTTPSSYKVAALTLLSYSPDSELSLQQHLDIAPDLLASYDRVGPDVGDQESSMMAHQVPHPTTDKRRVKVYELRENDWFDRGTGFCSANLVEVRYHALLSRLTFLSIAPWPASLVGCMGWRTECRHPQQRASQRLGAVISTNAFVFYLSVLIVSTNLFSHLV